MIKAIIFDFGNVISEYLPKDIFKQLSEKAGVPEKCFEVAYSEFRTPFDGGYINRAELYRKALKEIGMHKEAEDEALCQMLGDLDMESWSHPSEETKRWVSELKFRGYKTGVLSNMPFDFLELYGDDIEVFDMVDETVFSCDYHITKPEPEIYFKILEKLGITAEEAVFIDDAQRNIDGAARIGLRGILFENHEQAKRELEEILKINNNH